MTSARSASGCARIGLAIAWLKAARQKAVAGQLGLSWDEIHGIMDRAVKRGLARRQAEPIRHLGVDEKAFRKGHKYMTVVNDLVRGRVLYVAEELHAEFSHAKIAVDGLSLHLDRNVEGSWNWPATISNRNDTQTLTGYFASLHAGNLSLTVVDRSTGVTLELPVGDLDAYWQASQYRIAYRTMSKGRFQSADFASPLDHLILDANVSADALVLQHLSVDAGDSAIAVDHAKFAFASSDLAVAGSATIDAAQFLPDTSGRASVFFSLSGAANSPTADVRVTSDEVKTGDWRLQKVTVAARYHEEKLEIIDASARTLGARLRLRSLIDTRRSPSLTSASVVIGGIAIGSLMGNARIEARCVGTDWRRGYLSGVVRVAHDAEWLFKGG
jgi:hypothetical protein